MSTSKKRLNITLSKETEEAIKTLAEEDNVPRATKAAELLEDALSLYEDLTLNAIAKERMAAAKKNKEKYLSQDEVWKELLGE